MSKLTPQQKKDYLGRSYCHCPVCKSNDISGGRIEVDSDSAWQEVVCSSCGFRWNDIYKLIDIEEVE
jgi:transcription elongation factor Elf1